MPDYTLPKYDKPREWIRTCRGRGLDWDTITLARNADDVGLGQFLANQEDMNFWPLLSVEDWKSIVLLQKAAEEKAEYVSVQKGFAIIYNESEVNAVTIPQDSFSSWQLYKKKLLSDGFKEETVNEIENTTLKILKRLNNDTTTSGPVKGLVIGNVQSGKTANMAALMAMAADWGWNMFIVLSGTIENLRIQTQNRLFNDLNQQGTIFWRSLEHLSKSVDISQRAQSLHFDVTSKERVAAYASIAMYWMPEILYRFRRLCPKVDVDLRMVDHALEPFELLQSGKTDVIFASRQKEPKCEWIPLYHELLYAILPKQYPLNGRKEFPLREFEGKDFLMPYGRFDIDVHAAFAKEGVRAKEQSVYVDDETVIRMVGKGLGISMMSELMIRGNTEDVYCVPVSPTCIREIGMGMKPGTEENGSIAKLRECVMQFVSTLNKGGNVSLK